MPRQARLDAPGTLHHVVPRGIEKRRIVDDDKDRQNFVTRLGDLAKDTQTPIYAWSLLTNHAHLLLRSGPLGASKIHEAFPYGLRRDLQPCPSSTRTSLSESLPLDRLRRGCIFSRVGPLHSFKSSESPFGQHPLRELDRYSW